MFYERIKIVPSFKTFSQNVSVAYLRPLFTMKSVLLILMIIITNVLLGQESCVRDTFYYSNGQIELIRDFDTSNHKYCGVYITHDTLGAIISEGRYQSVDSVECHQCYDNTYSDFSEKWKQYYFAKHVNKVPFGEWKYYHNNGKLKEKGSYCDVVHEYQGMSYPIEWEGKSWPEPVAGYSTFYYLKDGTWEYYDLNGNNIRTEKYVCGQLVYLIERK